MNLRAYCGLHVFGLGLFVVIMDDRRPVFLCAVAVMCAGAWLVASAIPKNQP